MVSTNIDATTQFNATGKYNIDLNGWDYAQVNIITPAAAVSFNGTNDANAKSGISDGNAYTAINWQPISLTNTATSSGATSTAATGIFKLNVGARFLQLTGTTAAKILITLSSIN